MRHKYLVLLVIIVLLAACTSDQAETEMPELPTKTTKPTSTPVDTATPTLTDTPTPTPSLPANDTATPEMSELLEPGGYALSSDYYLFDLGTDILLTGPYFPYYIAFPKGEFEIEKDLHFSDDNNSVGIEWWDENQLVGLSIFIEPAIKCHDSINCRDYIWSFIQEKPDSEKNDVDFSEYDEYAVLARTVTEYSGVDINQRHFNAELVRDDHWIDIHLSKIDFERGEEKIFTEFLNAVEFVERSPFLMDVAGGLYERGAYEISLKIYNEVIAMGGPVAEMSITYKLRAQVLAQMGDYEAAIDDLLYGIELDDSDSTIYNQVCWNYGLIDKPDLALPYCEKAVAMDPDTHYLDSRGLVYALLGNYDAAIADFQIVVDELEGSTDPGLKSLYISRMAWLEVLESGENPITPEVLAELRGE